MQNKIVIIDYGMGNLRSVQKKFHRVGANTEISNDLELIANAHKLVLPGVGHFYHGIKRSYFTKKDPDFRNLPWNATKGKKK